MSYPLTWPGIVSTIERPPDASIQLCRTPTSRYCAARRWAGSGRSSGDTRPTDVESPMWATERQDVPGTAGRGPGGAGLPARALPGSPGRWPAPGRASPGGGHRAGARRAAARPAACPARWRPPRRRPPRRCRGGRGPGGGTRRPGARTRLASPDRNGRGPGRAGRFRRGRTGTRAGPGRPPPRRVRGARRARPRGPRPPQPRRGARPAPAATRKWRTREYIPPRRLKQIA